VGEVSASADGQNAKPSIATVSHIAASRRAALILSVYYRRAVAAADDGRRACA